MAKREKGRPPMTVDKLPENWEDIITNCYSIGCSDVEVRVELGISSTGWYSLLERDHYFSETVKEKRELCEAWWLKTGRSGLWRAKDMPELNATLWYMNMKNRFGWKDKSEVEHQGAQRVIIEEEIIGDSEDQD